MMIRGQQRQTDEVDSSEAHRGLWGFYDLLSKFPCYLEYGDKVRLDAPMHRISSIV